MQESYASAVSAASRMLSEVISDQIPSLGAGVREVDSLVREMVRAIGRETVQTVLSTAAHEVTEASREEGLHVERRPSVRFWCVFGCVEVESPYLRDAATGRSARPVKDRLGIRHHGRSRTLERALTDFGAEESFGHAAERFAEHYGFPVHRTTVMRVTEAAAMAAETMVRERLASAAGGAGGEADQVLVELDGCEIRTRTLVPSHSPETTPVRGLPRRQAVQDWREVRVGLARRLDEVQPTYVAAMAPYPDIVSSLVDAAACHGFSAETETSAVADGGNGLKEELEVQFPRLTFILDRPHAKGHLYETADAMGLQDNAREAWVRPHMEQIDAGQVRHVIAELRRHNGQGHERTRQLAAYLTRFRDCMHYQHYLARGLPIGSGEVESAHRAIPQKRLKLPGASWNPETINPMLALRTMRANQWWDDFYSEKQAA